MKERELLYVVVILSAAFIISFCLMGFLPSIIPSNGGLLGSVAPSSSTSSSLTVTANPVNVPAGGSTWITATAPASNGYCSSDLIKFTSDSGKFASAECNVQGRCYPGDTRCDFAGVCKQVCYYYLSPCQCSVYFTPSGTGPVVVTAHDVSNSILYSDGQVGINGGVTTTTTGTQTTTQTTSETTSATTTTTTPATTTTTTSAGGLCTGTSSLCSSLTEAKCIGQWGCSYECYENGKGAERCSCAGTAAGCSSFTTASKCSAQQGCSWTGATTTTTTTSQTTGTTTTTSATTETTTTTPPEGCTNEDPTVTVVPYSIIGSPGDTMNYGIIVTNNDNSECGTSTFTLSNDCPAGWTCVLNETSVAVAPGDSDTTAGISITSPNTADQNAYQFNVTAANSGNGLYASTSPAFALLSQFTFSGFSCSAVDKVCTIDYQNGGSTPVVIAIYLINGQQLVQTDFGALPNDQPTFTAPPFDCGSLAAGNYNVMFQLFFESDTTYSNPFFSPTSVLGMTCP